MICRLCYRELNEANSCEAHILPRGLFKEVAGKEYGKLMFIVGTDIERKRQTRTGIYDKDILCRKCDSRLGVYDKVVSEMIRHNKSLLHASGKYWTSNIDQKNIKLFCMSYIWRASISNRVEFSNVFLGRKHEDQIRQMLIKNDEGSVEDYTTLLLRYDNSGEGTPAILFPVRYRGEDGLCYYEGYLPRLFKFRIKVDSQKNAAIERIGLGASQEAYIRNLGNFHYSKDKSILIKAAKSSK